MKLQKVFRVKYFVITLAVLTLLSLISLSGFSSAESVNEISSCQIIDKPGYYILNNDLISDTQTTESCLTITAKDVTLNCKDYLIKNTKATSPLIYIRADNAHVNNCRLSSSFGTAISIIGDKNGILSDNKIFQSQTGIFLEKSESFEILRNKFEGNDDTILISDSSYITVFDNLIEKSREAGINLCKQCDNNQFISNTFKNNAYGLILDSSSHNLIDNNKFISNLHFGLLVTGNSIENTITNSEFTGNEERGIILSNGAKENKLKDLKINENKEDGLVILNANSNEISSVEINNNLGNGLLLEQSQNNIIKDLIIVNNKNGVFLNNSDNNVLKDSTLTSNKERNLLIYNQSNNNLIESNKIESSKDIGIEISSSSKNRFNNNNISRNKYVSIYLLYGSHNTFTNNNFEFNDEDFLLSVSDNTVIEGGFIKQTVYNVFNIDESNYTTIKNVSVSQTGSSGRDIIYQLPGYGLVLEDVTLKRYDFDQGYWWNNLVTFRNTKSGEIAFLEPITGKGEDLSSDISIDENLISISMNQPGFDKKARLTFYNLPKNIFNGLRILRNGSPCSSAICTIVNKTKEDGRVTIEVTKSGEYRLKEKDDDEDEEDEVVHLVDEDFDEEREGVTRPLIFEEEEIETESVNLEVKQEQVRMPSSSFWLILLIILDVILALILVIGALLKGEEKRKEHPAASTVEGGKSASATTKSLTTDKKVKPVKAEKKPKGKR